MVTWIRIIVVALALVAGLADRAGTTDTAAEVLEIESVVDDAVIETAAPEPRFVATLAFHDADVTLPHSPPPPSIFRPPRSGS